MMRSMISILLALLFAASATAIYTPDEDTCGGPPYSVTLAAHFKDGMVIKCSDADMLLMQKVLHAVISEDVLITGLDDFVPTLYPYAEQYSADAIIDHTGNLATPPEPAEVLAHLAPEDEIEFEYYFEGEQVVITFPPSTSPSTVPSSTPSLSQGPSTTPSDAPSMSSDKPSSTPSLSPTSKPSEGPSSGPSESPSAAPTVDDRRLQEIADEEAFVANGGTIVAFGTFKDGGQPMEMTQEERQEHHRKLQLSGCGGCSNGGTSNWCCTFCDQNCRRRRDLLEAVRSNIQPAEEGLSEEEQFNRQLLTWAPDGSKVNAGYKLKHVFSEDETLESYTKKVRQMEKRITKKLTRKFRFLALAERVTCLGQFWNFEVTFDTELELFYAELFTVL